MVVFDVVLQQTFLHQTHTRRCAFLHHIANKILRKPFQISLLFDCLRSAVYIRLSMVNLQGGGSRGHHDTSGGQRPSGTYCILNPLILSTDLAMTSK